MTSTTRRELQLLLQGLSLASELSETTYAASTIVEAALDICGSKCSALLEHEAVIVAELAPLLAERGLLEAAARLLLEAAELEANHEYSEARRRLLRLDALVNEALDSATSVE